MQARRKYKNSSGGFVQIILLILITLYVMKYSGLTVSDMVDWFKTTFADVLR